jgi:hypothetical protein
MINAHESGCSEEYEIKRNIVGVCRFWRNVGIELLYNEVVIVRSIISQRSFAHFVLQTPI